MSKAGAYPRVKKAVTLLVERRLAVYAIAFILTAIAVYFGSKLTLESDFAKMLPDTSPAVIEKNRAEAKLKNISSMVVLLEGDKPAEIEKYGLALAERLKKLPDIKFVDTGPPIDYFTDRALWYLSVDDLKKLYPELKEKIDKEIIKNNPFYIDLGDDDDEGGLSFNDEDIRKRTKKVTGREIRRYNINEDGTVFVIMLRPRLAGTDLKYNRKITKDVKAVVDAFPPPAKSEIEISYGGGYITSLAENDAIIHDLVNSIIITIIALILVIAIAFRRFRAAFLILFTLCIGVLLSLGFAYIAVGRLNSITGFIFAILMGLGIDFGIHLLSRYDEERLGGLSLIDACTVMIAETGRAALTGVLTTSAAFYALSAADFQGFSEFGIIAGTGVLFCFAAIIILLPPLLKTTEGWSSKTKFIPPPPEKKNIFLRNPKAVVAVFAALGILSLFSLPFMEWEYDFRNLERDDPESGRIRDVYMEALGLSLQPAVIISEGFGKSQKALESCKSVMKASGEDTTFSSCLGLASFIPEEIEKKRPLIKKLKELFPDDRYGRLPKDAKKQADKLLKMTAAPPPSMQDIPERIKSNFTGKEGDDSFLTLIYPGVELRDGRLGIKFSEEAFKIKRAPEDIGPAGQALIMADLLITMQNDAVIVTALSFILIMLLLFIDFRKLSASLFVFTPLAFSLLFLCGIMTVAGLKIGFFNMVVFPSLIGIGIDNSIHLMHRARMEGRGRLQHVVATTGRAASLAILTTMIGYCGLLFASHKGLFSIGLLAVLGLSSILVSMLILFPALMALKKPPEGKDVS